MQMSIAEILVISIGLSIDVFVAVAYLGAGFSKIRARNLAGLSLLFGGMQLGGLITAIWSLCFRQFRQTTRRKWLMAGKE